MAFRTYTPFTLPARPAGAYTLRFIDPFGDPMSRAEAEYYAALALAGLDASSIFYLDAMHNTSRFPGARQSIDSTSTYSPTRVRVLVKPKIKVRMKNVAVLVNSTAGNISIGSRHRTKVIHRRGHWLWG